MNRRAGKVSVGGVILVGAAVCALYFGAMYGPVLSHRMSIANVAREHAAKMHVEFDDARLKESIFNDVKARTGVQIGTSELFLQRKEGRVMVVTIKWTEQVKHLWGTNHVIKMQVTEALAPGNVRMKNAE